VKLKTVLFALVAVFGTVALLELALFLAGVTPLAEREDPFQGFSERVRVFEADEDRGVVRTRAAAVRHSFNYQEFPLDKTDNAFRIFVLGGSSAYGFPWGAAQAFPAALEKALAASMPDREVQAINAAGMSYGSHRLRILTHEVLQYEPDLLILYSGHNEFVERDLHDRLDAGPPLPAGLRLMLHRWRLYSALHRLIVPGGPAVTESGDAGNGAAALIGLDANREYSTDVAWADHEIVGARFEENLRAIVAAATSAGVPVVLCTMPSNERGWRPNQTTWPGSMSATDRAAAQRAIAAARSANDAQDPQAALRAIADIEGSMDRAGAGAWFEKGRALLALDQVSDAARAFSAARNLDGQPGRATESINNTIESVAGDTAATIAPVELAFRKTAANGIPGFDLFEDYVHPKPGAHVLIARELWHVLNGTNDDAFLAALDLPADFDYVSADDAPEAAGSERTASLVFNLAVVLENQGRNDEAMERYRRCLAMNPEYTVARVNLARLLALTGDARSAVEEYTQVLQVWPDHLASAIGLGEALRTLGMTGPAEAALLKATEIDGQSPGAWNALGSVYMVTGNHAAAERAYRRTVELDPDHLAVRSNLGMAVFFQGRLDDAETEFKVILDVRSDDPGAMNGMGAVAVERDDLGSARDWFGRVLALDPENALARQGLAEVERRTGG